MTIREGEKRREAHGATRGVLRGSTLLLVGRVISVVINFGVQVLAVRYLAKADYGAFAWAMAIAGMGASTVLLGLNRGVSRFAPIYLERREYGAMFGTMALALATVIGVGFAAVALVLGAQGLLVRHVESELSVALLLILIGLTPVEALDALFETLLAVFAGAKSIFFRRNVLAPGLKLLAVVGVISIQGSVQMLAAAYLAAGAIGIVLYMTLLWRALSRQGLLAELHGRRMEFPARALFGFSLPLLSTDLLLAVETPMVIIVLEHFRGTVEVADFRAAAQVAGLCLVAYQNFKILFRPHAARLFARGDEAGLGDLYWRTAAWVTVVTFPVFAVFVFLAEPVTVLVYGEKYRAAGVLLAILAAGKYFNAAMGMNTFTLQVYARVRLIVLINAGSAVLGLGLCLLMVPRFGAVGGAAATAAAIVIRNVCYQAGLIATTRVGVIPHPALKVYASVLAAAAFLWAVHAVSDDVSVMVSAVTLTTLLVPWFNRRFLDVLDTLPELARITVVRRLLSRRREIETAEPRQRIRWVGAIHAKKYNKW